MGFNDLTLGGIRYNDDHTVPIAIAFIAVRTCHTKLA